MLPRAVQVLGARVRWAPFTRTNIEIWAHGLAGASHYTPQRAHSSQGAFAYEVGGGIDINMHRWRYAYRIGADMVGTHYFGTNQFSPTGLFINSDKKVLTWGRRDFRKSAAIASSPLRQRRQPR